jgi:hypothetical protein
MDEKQAPWVPQCEAVWANKKYHGHRMLPPEMVASVKKSFQEHMIKLVGLKSVV